MPVEPFLLWVADINNVAAWTGFVYVAFVIDMFFRHIVGLRVSSSMKAELVPDALERALWERNDPEGLIYRSDRGSEYLSIGYVERLAGAGIEPSVGSCGDSYENALAETIDDLYKTEVIHRRGSTGSTTGGYSNRSATCRRQSWKRRIIANKMSQPWWPDSSKQVSGFPEAVQAAATG